VPPRRHPLPPRIVLHGKEQGGAGAALEGQVERQQEAEQRPGGEELQEQPGQHGGRQPGQVGDRVAPPEVGPAVGLAHQVAHPGGPGRVGQVVQDEVQADQAQQQPDPRRPHQGGQGQGHEQGRAQQGGCHVEALARAEQGAQRAGGQQQQRGHGDGQGAHQADLEHRALQVHGEGLEVGFRRPHHDEEGGPVSHRPAQAAPDAPGLRCHGKPSPGRCTSPGSGRCARSRSAPRSWAGPRPTRPG